MDVDFDNCLFCMYIVCDVFSSVNLIKFFFFKNKISIEGSRGAAAQSVTVKLNGHGFDSIRSPRVGR